MEKYVCSQQWEESLSVILMSTKNSYLDTAGSSSISEFTWAAAVQDAQSIQTSRAADAVISQ